MNLLCTLVIGMLGYVVIGGINMPMSDISTHLSKTGIEAALNWRPEFLQHLIRPNLPPILLNAQDSGFGQNELLRVDESNGLITLIMLIQDDCDPVELTFRSALPYVDAWAIINTHTQPEEAERINNLLQSMADEYNKPGSILHAQFVDESTTKNQLISFASQTYPSRFFFMMMATEELVDGEGLRSWCEAHRYSSESRYVVRATSDATAQAGREEWHVNSWFSTRLWRPAEGFRYQGHQFATLVQSNGKDPYRAHWGEAASGFSIMRSFESDQALEASYRATLGELQLDLTENPEDCRAMYSMAITYHNLEDYEQAIQWYQRRLACSGGLPEELFMSQLHIGKCMVDLSADANMLVSQFSKASSLDRHRAEPAFYLAEALRVRGDYTRAFEFAKSILGLPYPQDARVWITDSLYGSQGIVYDSLSVSCSHLPGRNQEGKAYAEKAAKALPNHPRIAANVRYFQSLHTEL